MWHKHKEPFYRGDGFTLTVLDAGFIVYAEGHKKWSVPARLDVTPPIVRIPRPEVWDYVVPTRLRGRYDTVMRRLNAHSGTSVVFDSDDQSASMIRFIQDDREATRKPCLCCDLDIVAPKHAVSGRAGEFVLDIEFTQAAIEARLADGRFEVIRSDVPVDQMLTVLEAESTYTLVAYLRCRVSDETIFWGLCIRGNPIYGHRNATAPFSWPWDPGRPLVDNAPTRPDLSLPTVLPTALPTAS